MVAMQERAIEGPVVDGSERTAMFGSVDIEPDWFVFDVRRFNDRFLQVILWKDENAREDSDPLRSGWEPDVEREPCPACELVAAEDVEWVEPEPALDPTPLHH
jgi:hypothetical protein